VPPIKKIKQKETTDWGLMVGEPDYAQTIQWNQLKRKFK
jgi:hypothetical protein